MISAFNDMKKVRRFHFRAHIFEKIERTKWITRSLHKEDRRSQSAQNFIAKFCAITGGAKRIAETNDCIHLCEEAAPAPGAKRKKAFSFLMLQRSSFILTVQPNDDAGAIL